MATRLMGAFERDYKRITGVSIRVIWALCIMLIQKKGAQGNSLRIAHGTSLDLSENPFSKVETLVAVHFYERQGVAWSRWHGGYG